MSMTPEDLLSEYERSIIDFRFRRPTSRFGIKQSLAHIRNVRRKLVALGIRDGASEIERRNGWKTN